MESVRRRPAFVARPHKPATAAAGRGAGKSGGLDRLQDVDERMFNALPAVLNK